MVAIFKKKHVTDECGRDGRRPARLLNRCEHQTAAILSPREQSLDCSNRISEKCRSTRWHNLVFKGIVLARGFFCNSAKLSEVFPLGIWLGRGQSSGWYQPLIDLWTTGYLLMGLLVNNNSLSHFVLWDHHGRWCSGVLSYFTFLWQGGVQTLSHRVAIRLGLLEPWSDFQLVDALLCLVRQKTQSPFTSVGNFPLKRCSIAAFKGWVWIPLL